MLFGLLLAAFAQQIDQPRIVRLSNGLRVVIVEQHGATAVSVQLWYRGGAGLRYPSNYGLYPLARAFLEHRENLATRLRAAGVRFESATLPDACYFASTLPPELLDTVLKLEVRRMRPVDPAGIDISIATRHAARTMDAATIGRSVRNALGWDDPADFPSAELMTAAFPRDSRRPDLAQSGGGRMGVEGNIGPSADDLASFLTTWFVPGNATLFIIGDIEALPTEDLVRRRFSEIAWREPPRRAAWDRPKKDEVRLEDQSAGRSGLDLAWVTLPWGYFENAAIDVLMHALCNPVDGSLALRLREKGFGEPRFRRFAWYDAGLLILSVDVSRERHEEAEEIIRAALKAAEAELPTVTQLNRAATGAAGHIIESRTTFRRRALQLASHEIIGGDMQLAAMERGRYERVGAGDLRIAAAMLSRMRRVVVHRSEAAKSPAVRMASLPIERLSGERGLAFLRALADEGTPDSTDRSGRSAWITERENDSATVALRSNPWAEDAIVRTTVSVPFDAGLPAVYAPMQGAADYDAERMHDYLSYHGIALAPFSDGRRHGLMARGPSSRIAQMLEWHAKLLRSPNLSDSALEDAIVAATAARDRLIADPRALADHLADRAVVSLRPQFPSVGVSVDELRGELEKFGGAMGTVKVEIAGRFDREVVLNEVRRLWPKTDSQQRVRPSETTNERPVSPVRISWQPRASGDVHVRVVVRGIESAEKSMGIRAMCRLIGPPKGQMADIDGDRRWLWRCRAVGPSTMIASAETSASSVARELTSILRRVEAIRDGSISPDERRFVTRLAHADSSTVEFSGIAQFADETAGRGVSIIIVGGDESLVSALAALGELHRLPPQ